jgi:hypothetical protein
MAIKKKKLPAKKKKTSGKAKVKVKKKKVVSKKKKIATKKKKTVAKKKKTVAKKKKAVAKKKRTPAGKKKAVAKKKKAVARKRASIAKAKAKARDKARAKAKIAAQKAWIIEKARRKALRTTRYFFPHEIGVPGRWETILPGGRYQVVGEPKVKSRIRPEIPTTTIFRDELPETTLEREPEQYRDEEPEEEPEEEPYYYEEPEVEIVRAPEPEPEPEPEPAPEIPFYFIETGAAAMYSEPGMDDEEHYQYASNLNAAPLDRMTIEGTSRIATVFERAFIGALNKGPFEADEIHIYRHGVSFRPRSGEFTDSNRKAITELLADYPGSSVHVTREPGGDGAKDTFSIRINVGSSNESGNFLSTSENMDYHKDVFQAIYSYMQDEYDGDVDWNAFWDTEESMYE